MQNRSERGNDQYMLRLPDGWRAAVKALAVKNHRSMNSEILAAIEFALGAAATGAKFGDRSPAAALSQPAVPAAVSFNLSDKDTENDIQ